VNSCTKSPEDGPVGPKHVEIQQYTNKIVTSIWFSFHMMKSDYKSFLTLILLTWSIGRAPNNARKWQMEFNLAFKGLNVLVVY